MRYSRTVVQQWLVLFEESNSRVLSRFPAESLNVSAVSIHHASTSIYYSTSAGAYTMQRSQPRENDHALTEM